jgi:glycosyl hydrolase family 44
MSEDSAVFMELVDSGPKSTTAEPTSAAENRLPRTFPSVRRSSATEESAWDHKTADNPTGTLGHESCAGGAVRVRLSVALILSGWLVFGPSVRAQNPGVTISIDVNAGRHRIDPNIYGIAQASAAQLSDLNVPLNRNGGNNTTRYNWQQNADNRGNDWYYESIADASAVAGERGDTFFSTSLSANAQAMLTVPLIDWVAKVGTNRSKLASFSIAKYGAQTGSDSQWFPDAGNGVLTSGQNVTGNDPNDANVPSSSTFQQGWIQHLVGRWGTNANGGVRYYVLDNEPSIWHSTHRDVHPVGATMNEIRDKMVDYAGKIKAVDPSALVVGPEEWGWSGYFYSGYDQQYGSLHGWSTLPDRQNHGGADYLPWLLDSIRQSSATAGRRLLDVFTVHYYPQGGEFSDDTSSTMQLRRNRSTRSLWDPNYVDETWINDKVMLIPRLRSWVNTYYPGTAIGITEYNWGAEIHINGATTQADILGIFGREGLDAAARWTTPDSTTPTYKAIKMYRNYDGNRSTFGDTSVTATVPDPNTLAAFAAQRSTDGAVTVMVINKSLSGTTQMTMNLAHFADQGTAQVWQLTSANAITRAPDATVTASSVALTLPAQSITLLVVGSGAPSAPTGLTVKPN